ncbi:hypothetical protein [Mycetohabitans endofungorum]|uniref:hypothetical protein n=1 Tax=Mycetohabitans endofungorum TaxID=417203 RepID=UPI002B057A71|nr:hypothetical protein [Mycetohabitans endofungorum]
MKDFNFEFLRWIPCASYADMDAQGSKVLVIDTLQTDDPSSWGYFQTPDGRHINVCYADVGLIPQSVAIDGCVIVGIDERLVGYDLANNTRYFSCRMPFIFHEFVEIGDSSLIVRDEMGFMGIAHDGTELWRFCAEGVIGSFTIAPYNISGETVDGGRFAFEIPVKK